jgi:hypothetical protein
MRKKFRNFIDARKFVQSLGLKNTKEWEDYCKSGKKPDDIPYAPQSSSYRNEWKGITDWLGNGNVANKDRKYLSFEESRKFVRELGLKSTPEWGKYSKSNRPNNIPSNPHLTYKDEGWVDWGNFLGTGTVKPGKMQYMSFNDSREFVRKLGLKNSKEWQKYCVSGDRPNNINTNPSVVFKEKGWINWGDWLGTGAVDPKKIKFRSLKEAREFVRSLGLKSIQEWKDYCKSGNKPYDIPSTPWSIYKKLKKK